MDYISTTISKLEQNVMKLSTGKLLPVHNEASVRAMLIEDAIDAGCKILGPIKEELLEDGSKVLRLPIKGGTFK